LRSEGRHQFARNDLRRQHDVRGCQCLLHIVADKTITTRQQAAVQPSALLWMARAVDQKGTLHL